MKEPSDDEVINLNQLVLTFGKVAVVLFALIVCLRFPVIWIKVPLMIVVASVGLRWMLKPGPKRMKTVEVTRPVERTGEVRPLGNSGSGAIVDLTEPEDDVVRRLIALDAAGEFGKAKTLIQQLDGEEFPEGVGIEVAAIAGNYFPVEIEPSENGVRFKLV